MDTNNSVENALRVKLGTSRGIRRLFLIIGAGTAAVAMFGFMGVAPGCNHCDATDGSSLTNGWFANFLAAVLQTAQLFLLSVSSDDLCNWPTRIASILAPLATIVTVFTYFSHRFGTWIRQHLLSMYPADTIFIGGGKSATSIALQLLGNPSRQQVICIDNADEPLISDYTDQFSCRLFEWQGNALKDQVLISTNVANATEVWVLTGDDRRNIEVVQRMAALPEQTVGKRKQLVISMLNLLRQSNKCSSGVKRSINVNVYDQELLRVLPAMLHGHHDVHFFSMPRLAARQLLLRYPPRLPRFDKETHLVTGRLHIAVVGDDDLALAIVEQAIVHFIYSDQPDDSVRITLIARNAIASMATLNQRILESQDIEADSTAQTLLPLADLHAVNAEPEHLSQQVWAAAQKEYAFDAVYVSDPVDLHTFTAALRIASLREMSDAGNDLPIVACLSQAQHEHGAINKDNLALKPHNFEQFRVFDCLDASENYPGASTDGAAKLINLAYQKEGLLQYQSDLGTLKNDAEKAWMAVDDAVAAPRVEMNQASSRHAADHICVKLACLYPDKAADFDSLRQWVLDKNNKDKGVPASDQSDWALDAVSFDWLMKLEHRRFVVDHLIDGWLPAPAMPLADEILREKIIKRRKDYRLNETLKPYEELSIDEKDKIRRMVACLPLILQWSEVI